MNRMSRYEMGPGEDETGRLAADGGRSPSSDDRSVGYLDHHLPRNRRFGSMEKLLRNADPGVDSGWWDGDGCPNRVPSRKTYYCLLV